MSPRLLASLAVVLLGVSGCAATDRAAGTDLSGRYPQNRASPPANPPGTVVERGIDRAVGTNTSGAYPQNSPAGRNTSPPGTALDRTYDSVTGDNVSGANPQNMQRRTR